MTDTRHIPLKIRDDGSVEMKPPEPAFAEREYLLNRIIEQKAELDRLRKEYQEYKTHYDRIYAKSVVVPTEEFKAILKERYELKSKLSVAEGALKEIAGADYRGNRPREQTLAYEALSKIQNEGE